ncbi:hypothetical protein ABEB36_007370 [Hypothenemus hampei]|uniref:Pentatricopeptide repeat-containing protein 2 n=1 Tax=Hypothenemus hampei TaxID=57062 RepID=A0ABD1ETR4_HYPHA
MANTLLTLLRKPLTNSLLSKTNNISLTSLYIQDVKYLFSKASLGLDGFSQQSEKIKLQLNNIADKFREKMSEYVTIDSKNMIFTEDLKNMVHLTENDQDIQLTVEMLKKYNKQNKSLRFGNYVFGPVVMRMFYVHNKPDLALECFKSEELTGIFDQHISFQLLLDLLYENQRYQEMLDVFQIISEKQLEGQKYPKNVIVLILAACYKLNNQESLDWALKLWTQLSEVGHIPMRRASTFCAGLAFNQGKPDIALEILSSVRNQNYTTVRNLKVVALAEIGRLDDVIPILKFVLSDDTPQNENVHTFNRDVLEKVKQAVSKSNNPEITLEFNRVEQMLIKQGHVSQTSLDEQLCSEIQRPPINRDFRAQQNFQPRGFNNEGFQQRPRRINYQRPGLSELV